MDGCGTVGWTSTDMKLDKADVGRVGGMQILGWTVWSLAHHVTHLAAICPWWDALPYWVSTHIYIVPMVPPLHDHEDMESEIAQWMADCTHHSHLPSHPPRPSYEYECLVTPA
jgi:hypothetical protein